MPDFGFYVSAKVKPATFTYIHKVLQKKTFMLRLVLMKKLLTVKK